MDVKRFRLTNGLKVKEMVGVLRAEYPRYSKITHSMVENPASYGVKLLPEAEQVLRDMLERPDHRTGDRHRNRYRLSCRLTESRYNAVKQAIEADGRWPTVQAWLDWWVYVWLKGQEKAAPGGKDTQDGNKKNNPMDNLPQKGGGVNDGTS